MPGQPIPDIADRLIETALPDVVFDGWSRDLLENAAEKAGYSRSMATAIFPDGVPDALAHYSDFVDRRMLAALANVDPEALRVRDRIRLAVMTRLDVLQPWREAEKLALRYWAVPTHSLRGSRLLWRTADRIWDWAGDTSKDYNRYTKRGLLCGVLSATLLAWINEEGDGSSEAVEAFLDRRIENVMQWGRFAGKFKKPGRQAGSA